LQQEVAGCPGLHPERHLQHCANDHDADGDAVPGNTREAVLKHQRGQPVNGNSNYPLGTAVPAAARDLGNKIENRSLKT
jgi:hypothetical protein